jgi:propanediol dehydratase small subunit
MSGALKEQLDRVASGAGEEVAAILDIVAHDLRNTVATIRMECAVLAVEGRPEKIEAIAANLERTADGVARMVSIMERFIEERDEGGAP